MSASILAFRSECNPPVPKSVIGKDEDNKFTGQHILSLLRRLRKNASVESLDSILEETVVCFRSVILQTARRGLLCGDEDVAVRLLASYSSGRDGKRETASKAHNDGGIEKVGTGQPSFDVDLLMDSVLLILKANDDSILISLSSDLITATCEYVIARSKENAASQCVIAEFELIAKNGKTLLGALERSAKGMLAAFPSRCGLLHADSDETDVLHALKTCLRASASLVGILGTKLSRSVALIDALKNTSYSALRVACSSVVESATVLLSTLPFAGGLDRVTPIELWYQTIVVSLRSLRKVFMSVAPIGRIKKLEVGEDLPIPAFCTDWLASIHNLANEHERVESFLHLVRSLNQLVIKSLRAEALNKSNARANDSVSVDICLLLDVVEFMISFPIAAETAFFTTKKRLRGLLLEDGCVSPASLIEYAANDIKTMGNETLRQMLTAFGGPALLPFMVRISKLTHDALLTSTSTPLRKVIDPATNVQVDGKRRRWVQASLTSRTGSVKAFRDCVAVFGGELKPKPSKIPGITAQESQSNTEKCLKLVMGNIVELLSKETVDDENWGSSSESIDLLLTCLHTMTGCLVSGGEYFTDGTRSFVDSIIRRCLSVMVSFRDPMPSSFTTAVLELSIAAVSTPWPDGAASFLEADLRITCHRLINGGGHCVDISRGASQAIRTCDLLSCSRSPALVMVKRAENPDPSLSYEQQRDFLKTAQADIDHSREKERLSKKREIKAKEQHDVIKKTKNDAAPSKELRETASEAPLTKTTASDAGHTSTFSNTKVSAVTRSTQAQGGTQDTPVALRQEESRTNDTDASEEEAGLDFPMIVDCGPDDDDE